MRQEEQRCFYKMVAEPGDLLGNHLVYTCPIIIINGWFSFGVQQPQTEKEMTIMFSGPLGVKI